MLQNIGSLWLLNDSLGRQFAAAADNNNNNRFLYTTFLDIGLSIFWLCSRWFTWAGFSKPLKHDMINSNLSITDYFQVDLPWPGYFPPPIQTRVPKDLAATQKNSAQLVKILPLQSLPVNPEQVTLGHDSSSTLYTRPLSDVSCRNLGSRPIQCFSVGAAAIQPQSMETNPPFCDCSLTIECSSYPTGMAELGLESCIGLGPLSYVSKFPSSSLFWPA